MISAIEVSPGAAPQMIKLVRVSQNARKQVVFKLTTPDGMPVNLREEIQNPPAPAPNFAPQAAATGVNVEVRLVISPNGQLYGDTKWNILGQILDQQANPGFVQFDVTTAHTNAAGIYEATILRQVTGGHIVDTWPVLVAIEPSAMNLLTGHGPITIPEVRMTLLDLDQRLGGTSSFSNLLDDVEFTDIEIVFAMRQVVDLWNSTPPPVAVYSPGSFPYRYWWLQGTSAILLRMGASRYRRNQLAYSAGGVSVNDQSKAEEYETIGKLRMDEFREWMRTEKYRINMDRCWGIGL